MVDVPHGGQIVAGETVQQVTQHQSIGVNACSLDQQHDAGGLRLGQQPLDGIDDQALIPVVAIFGSLEIDIGYLHHGRQADAVLDASASRFMQAGIAQVGADGQTGDAQLQFDQTLGDGLTPGSGVRPVQQLAYLGLAPGQLETFETQLLAETEIIGPGKIRPTAGRI